jgi:hypothetical protein
MTANRKKLAKTMLGVVVGLTVIGATLKTVGLTPVVIVYFVAAGILIFLAFKIRAKRKSDVIFGFYVAADEVLRADERSRYRFEVAEVIRRGERVVRQMPDPPPLSRFALGALYYSINDHNAAVEQLGFAAEEEVLKESSHVSPSRPLRRYVERLRRIERSPRRSAKIKAAIASLEGMHQERAARLLAESQQHLKRMVEAYDSEITEQLNPPRSGVAISTGRSLKSITAPPPISEVLQDIYQEEPKAS